MLTSAECSAKADEMTIRAAASPAGPIRAAYESTADGWRHFARTGSALTCCRAAGIGRAMETEREQGSQSTSRQSLWAKKRATRSMSGLAAASPSERSRVTVICVRPRDES